MGCTSPLFILAWIEFSCRRRRQNLHRLKLFHSTEEVWISPDRTRTYDQSVNSRPLYHWATEEKVGIFASQTTTLFISMEFAYTPTPIIGGSDGYSNPIWIVDGAPESWGGSRRAIDSGHGRSWLVVPLPMIRTDQWPIKSFYSPPSEKHSRIATGLF